MYIYIYIHKEDGPNGKEPRGVGEGTPSHHPAEHSEEIEERLCLNIAQAATTHGIHESVILCDGSPPSLPPPLLRVTGP